MKCEKCGAQVPEDTKICPECGAQLEAVREDAPAEEKPREESAPQESTATAVRPQTVPQRPHTEYPASRRDRKRMTRVDGDEPTKTEKPRDAAARKRRGRAIRRAVTVFLLLLLVGGLLWGGISIARSITQNRQEEPELTDIHAGEEQNTRTPDNEEPEETEPAATAYDLAGVWVWDSDLDLMRETVWRFGEDSSLQIFYFGIGDPENPYDAWPEHYAYNRDTSTLTMGGEVLNVVWKNENSFHIESAALGACDAKRTDEDHVPTGAADIRTLGEDAAASGDGSGTATGGETASGTASGETGSGTASGTTDTAADTKEYYFADSDSRFLKRSECQALTADELRIARNEIYARRGRLFDSEDLQAYFNAQSWYKGTTSPANFNYNSLNDYERYNVNLMKSIEDAKRG